MAGFLRIYGRQPWALSKEYAVGAADNVKGVVFDGFYFWIVTEASLLQCWINNDDVFCIIRTITLGTGITGFTEASAICTDGYNLFIAYRTLVGAPAASNSNIAIFNKDGLLINILASASAVSASWGNLEYLDITHDGLYLYATHSVIGIPASTAHWKKFDVFTDTLMFDVTAVGRLSGAGIAFDGMNFILLVAGAGNQTFAVFDQDYNQLSDSLGTALTTAQGICFGSSDPMNSTRLAKGFLDQLDGEWVGLVYN